MHCDSHCVTRSICPRLIWMEKKKEDEANIYKEMEQVDKWPKKSEQIGQITKSHIFSL